MGHHTKVTTKNSTALTQNSTKKHSSNIETVQTKYSINNTVQTNHNTAKYITTLNVPVVRLTVALLVKLLILQGEGVASLRWVFVAGAYCDLHDLSAHFLLYCKKIIICLGYNNATLIKVKAKVKHYTNKFLIIHLSSNTY